MLSRESAKNPFPTSYFSSSIQFNLLSNNLIIMYGLPNVDGLSCKISGFNSSHFSVKNSLLCKAHCNKTFRLKEPIHIAIFGIISLLTNISLDKTNELIYNMFFNINAIFH